MLEVRDRRNCTFCSSACSFASWLSSCEEKSRANGSPICCLFRRTWFHVRSLPNILLCAAKIGTRGFNLVSTNRRLDTCLYISTKLNLASISTFIRVFAYESLIQSRMLTLGSQVPHLQPLPPSHESLPYTTAIELCVRSARPGEGPRGAPRPS